MRRIEIEVEAGRGDRLLAAARELGALHATLTRSQDDRGVRDVLVATVENDLVGPLLDAADDVGPIRARWHPSGVVSLVPPAGEKPGDLLDVSQRSPIEIVLAGRMSAGSWTGVLSFAALAGAVVWVGLVTGTWYLLTAAMLLAPFAGPAMNAAIATAHGDAPMLRHAVARYSGSILTTAAVAFVLQLAFGSAIPTPFMVNVVSVSSVAVLLPITAGVAGALYLIQSEQSSLVSGAAVGMLVAASLAPPAGMLGITVATGTFELAARALFVLVLQLVGIELTATLTFRWAGVRPDVPRAPAPHAWLLPVAMPVTLLLVVGMVVVQLSTPTHLQRLTLEERAIAEIDEVVEVSGAGDVLDADVRYAPLTARNALLASVTVRVEASAPDDVDEQLSSLIATALRNVDATVEPLVDVTVVRPVGPPRD